MKKFNKVAIIGVGLIGGSIGLAIKNKKLANQVVGVARKEKTLKDALKLKAVDKVSHNIQKAVQGADLVVLCQPVEAIALSLPKISRFLKPGAIVIDVGSAKERIVKAAERFFPKKVFFVGCHPLAGSEKKGVNFASAQIFHNSLCLLTPTSRTNRQALKITQEFWHKLGARTVMVKPSVHDRILSFVSHLPHVVAFSLINSIPSSYLKFSSSGLRDTTRIASSDATIWKDICLANSAQILKSINRFESVLKRLKRQISLKDAAGLQRSFSRAQKIRNSLNARRD